MKIEMKNFTVEVNNAETVAAAMDSLPIYQSIRGCDQWTQEKRDALVKDILGGMNRAWKNAQAYARRHGISREEIFSYQWH